MLLARGAEDLVAEIEPFAFRPRQPPGKRPHRGLNDIRARHVSSDGKATPAQQPPERPLHIKRPQWHVIVDVDQLARGMRADPRLAREVHGIDAVKDDEVVVTIDRPVEAVACRPVHPDPFRREPVTPHEGRRDRQQATTGGAPGRAIDADDPHVGAVGGERGDRVGCPAIGDVVKRQHGHRRAKLTQAIIPEPDDRRGAIRRRDEGVLGHQQHPQRSIDGWGRGSADDWWCLHAGPSSVAMRRM